MFNFNFKFNFWFEFATMSAGNWRASIYLSPVQGQKGGVGTWALPPVYLTHSLAVLSLSFFSSISLCLLSLYLTLTRH